MHRKKAEVLLARWVWKDVPLTARHSMTQACIVHEWGGWGVGGAERNACVMGLERRIDSMKQAWGLEGGGGGASGP